MARQPENTFIASIHRLLPQAVYRQKNHNTYNSGIPDCWYSGAESDLWVEYKYVELPKRPDTVVPINLSELQKNWIRRRCAEGRAVGVIVGCIDGGVWLPGTSWGTPITENEFWNKLSSRQTLAELIYTETMLKAM